MTSFTKNISQTLLLLGEQTSVIEGSVIAEYQSNFNTTTVAPAAGAVSI